MVPATRDDKGKLIKVQGCRSVPEHLKTLRIPPAWTSVEVSIDPAAKCWASGVDVKGRLQRLYSSMHVAAASTEKFGRVQKLIHDADVIRSKIEVDVKRKVSVGARAEESMREAAIVAYLIFETGIRPGSNAETKGDVRAFGATTLQARHVKIMSSGRVWLRFIGKKGVRIKLRVTNPWLVEQLVKRKNAADGAYTTPIFNVSDGLLRKYCRTLADGSYSPKDFRTMRGTSLAAALLKGRRIPKNKTAINRLLRHVVKKVAKALGNTPAVCRKSYIDPAILPKLPTESAK